MKPYYIIFRGDEIHPFHEWNDAHKVAQLGDYILHTPRNEWIYFNITSWGRPNNWRFVLETSVPNEYLLKAALLT